MTKRVRTLLITLGAAFLIALPAGFLVGKTTPDGLFDGWAWEDVLTTAVGAWMILCVPLSIVRWVAVPNARYGKSLTLPVAGMLAGGISLVLPVVGQGVLDPALMFGVVVALFAAMAVLQLVQHGQSDEMMRRFSADSTVISSILLTAAFALYAAGERLGVIGTVSPWGLVGIACLVQFAVAMYVYYKLGLDPDAQEKVAG